jgi:hypothetical protein
MYDQGKTATMAGWIQGKDKGLGLTSTKYHEIKHEEQNLGNSQKLQSDTTIVRHEPSSTLAIPDELTPFIPFPFGPT